MDSDGEASESDHDSIDFIENDDSDSDFEEGDEYVIQDVNRVVGERQNYGDGWTTQPNPTIVNQFNFTENEIDYAQLTESQWFKTFMSDDIIQWYL